MEYAGRIANEKWIGLAAVSNPKWVMRHEGPVAEFLKRYRMHAADAVKAVAKGEPVKWMGYGIHGTANELIYTVTTDAWDHLREALATAHGKPNSPIAAIRSIAGWVADKGPCYPHTHSVWAYDRIERMATEQAFEEILGRDELKGLWQRAYARWMKLRAKVAGH